MTGDDELDPVLAEAYAAERRVTTEATRAVADRHEQMLLAICERLARPPAAVPVTSLWRRVGLALAAAAVGGAVGFAAGRGTQPTAPPPAPAISAPPTDAAIDAAVMPDAGVDAAIDAAVPAPHAAGTRPLAEPLLIDRARAALRRGLLDEARAALAEHQRRYPTGQLREERDVLAIELALAEDRLADANEQIAHYFEQYPHGGLAGRVSALQQQVERRIGRH